MRRAMHRWVERAIFKVLLSSPPVRIGRLFFFSLPWLSPVCQANWTLPRRTSVQAHETLRQDRRLSKEHVEREEQELVVIIVQDLQQLAPLPALLQGAPQIEIIKLVFLINKIRMAPPRGGVLYTDKSKRRRSGPWSFPKNTKTEISTFSI